MRRSFLLGGLILGISVSFVTIGYADLPLDISNTQSGSLQFPSGQSDLTVGWQFTITTPIRVSGLGIWDQNSDGLINNNHSVGLWTSGGTLLASSVLSGNGAYQIASTYTGGRWDFNSIAPIILSPGTYVTGAFYSQVFVPPDLTNSDPFRVGNPDVTPLTLVNIFPGLTYNGASSTTAAGFSFPTSFDPTITAFFGATIDISPVPEPTTVILVFLSISIGIVYVSRRFVQRKVALQAEIGTEAMEE